MKPPFAPHPQLLPSPRMRLPPPPPFVSPSTVLGGNNRGNPFSPCGPPLFCSRGPRPPFGRAPPFGPPMPPLGRFPMPPSFGLPPNRLMKNKKPQMPAKNNKNEVKFNKPWIDEILQNEILKKHKMHQKARKSKKSSEWEVFREQRNKVTALLREAKMNFEGKKGGVKKEVNFYCDTCDRGFETKDEMDEHMGQHQKCDRDGCTFEAHFKIVELHIKMQHDSGYAMQIMNLSDPKTIEKWREERKKNFPTAQRTASLAVKPADKAENQISPKKGPNSNRGGRRVRGRGGHRMRGGGGRFMRRDRQNLFPMGFGGPPMMPLPPFPQRMAMQHGWRRGSRGRPYIIRKLINDDTKFGLKMFKGINQTVDQDDAGPANGNEPSENASVVSRKVVEAQPRDPKADPLSYVLADSAEDSDDAPLEIKTTKEACQRQPPPPTLGGGLGLLMDQYASEADTDHETAKQDKTENDATTIQPRPNVEQHRQRRRNHPRHDRIQRAQPYVPHRKYQVSLLQKLLAREIKHERNVILQCVQYIHRNAYFGIGQQ